MLLELLNQVGASTTLLLHLVEHVVCDDSLPEGNRLVVVLAVDHDFLDDLLHGLPQLVLGLANRHTLSSFEFKLLFIAPRGFGVLGFCLLCSLSFFPYVFLCSCIVRLRLELFLFVFIFLMWHFLLHVLLNFCFT